MKLGEYIRKLREQKDLSLREFASQIEKSPAFISDIELGRRNPSKELLNEIAVFFNVDVKDLEKYDERVPIEQMKKVLKEVPEQGATLGLLLRKATEKRLTTQDKQRLIQTLDEISDQMDE